MLPFNRLQKSNTIENLWIYILSTLKKRPLYGYEIPKLIEKNFNFKPGRITPYRVLYRLAIQGLVKSKTEKRRKVYRITDKGKKELEKAREFYNNLIQKLS